MQKTAYKFKYSKHFLGAIIFALIFGISYTSSTRNKSGIFYDEDNIISYSDTEGNIFSAGTITISDGENAITMLDRNLGATSNNPKSYCSHGYYYQFGNNYGFPLEGYHTSQNSTEMDCNSEPTGSHTNGWLGSLDLDKYLSILTGHFNREGEYYGSEYSNIYIPKYGPSNWYIYSKIKATALSGGHGGNARDIFDHYNYYGASEQIENLRGGANDEEGNNRDYGNNKDTRQGPCPEGYHIPSAGEFNQLIKLRVIVNNIDDDKINTGKGGIISINKESGSNGFKIFNELKFPYYAGYIGNGYRNDGNNHYLLDDSSVNGYYWSSSRSSLGTKLTFNNDGGMHTTTSDAMTASPIRCFKDEPIDISIYNPHKEKTIIFDANGGYYENNSTTKQITYTRNELNGEYKPNENYIQIPHRDSDSEIYIFDGRYTDKESYNKERLGLVDDSTPTEHTVYAKRYHINDSNNIGIFYGTGTSIAYTDPNENFFKASTITISDGKNIISMLDRNLGATTTNLKSHCSHGYYYQRGNNYGFSLTGRYLPANGHTTKNGCQEYDASDSPYANALSRIGNLDKSIITLEPHLRDKAYGPNNAFTSNRFVVYNLTNDTNHTEEDPYYDEELKAVRNMADDQEIFYRNNEYGIPGEHYGVGEELYNIRGGGNDSSVNSYDNDNPKSERKGPCPTGYHIPSLGELNKLILLYANTKSIKQNIWFDDIVNYNPQNSLKLHNIRFKPRSNEYSFEMFNDLLLPYYGGWLDQTLENNIRNNHYTDNHSPIHGVLRSSSMGGLNFYTNGVLNAGMGRNIAPIRCFKDEPLDPATYNEGGDTGGGNNEKIYTLTINYIYSDGTTTTSSYSANFTGGAFYSIKSPTINGYTPNQTIVSGTMPNSDKTITVTYSKNIETPQTYTLTINYKYNDGGQASPSVTKNLVAGESYSIISPNISNYTASTSIVKGTMPNSDKTIDIVYTKIASNGGGGGSSSSNEDYSNDLTIKLGNNNPYTDERIKLIIDVNKKYTGKVYFTKLQYYNTSTSKRTNIYTTSTSYISDYGNDLDIGYVRFTSSDQGRITISKFIKFAKTGKYRIYAEDKDGEDYYIQFTVDGDDSISNNYDSKDSNLSISVSNSQPKIYDAINITLKTDNYIGKIKLYAKYKDSSNNWTKISNNSSSEYFSDFSNIWENGYYKMISSDNGKKTLYDLIEFKKSGTYRIYAEDEQGYFNYITIELPGNSTSNNSTNTTNTQTKTESTKYNNTGDDIDKLINELLGINTSNNQLTTNDNNQNNDDIERNKNNLKNVSDEIYKSRSCKEYRIHYDSSLGAFTSPNLQKTEYFINKEYFKRYIDSKNPQKEGCPNNTGWITTSYKDSSSSSTHFIAPNGKIYFISGGSGSYYSNNLTSKKSFPTLPEIKNFIKSRNPLIGMESKK